MRYALNLCQSVVFGANMTNTKLIPVVFIGAKDMFFSDDRVKKSYTTISQTPSSSISLLSSCHWRTARAKTSSTLVACSLLMSCCPCFSPINKATSSLFHQHGQWQTLGKLNYWRNGKLLFAVDRYRVNTVL